MFCLLYSQDAVAYVRIFPEFWPLNQYIYSMHNPKLPNIQTVLLSTVVPGIALVQEIFGLCYNFRELSIPLFGHNLSNSACHQWHVPDSQSCLRISQVLTLINKIGTLWVIEALSLCDLYALRCSESIWIYCLDIHVWIFQETLGIQWSLTAA